MKQREIETHGATPRNGAWLDNTPWWALSAGVHAVILLGLTLIYVESYTAVDDGSLIVIMRPAAPVLTLPTPEPPRGIEDHPSPIADDPRPEVALTEKEIVFPMAETSNHNETKNDLSTHTMLGDSREYMSWMPGLAGGATGVRKDMNPGMVATMGVGGGGGGAGRFGSRDGGGDKDLVARNGGNTGTQGAVLQALLWLARHQAADGSWSAGGFHAQCRGALCIGEGNPDYDPGVTGLALLAFLGSGYTQFSHTDIVDPADPSRKFNFGKTVKNGVRWLMSHQDADGCVGGKSAKQFMYNHAIATLALCEDFGMTLASPVKASAQQAIDFLIAAQNPYRGWRYSALSGDTDTSVTGWCVMALKSAHIAGLATSQTGFESAYEWIVSVTEPAYGRTGYTSLETAGVKVAIAGKNEQFAHHEALTAIGMMCRTFIKHDPKDPALASGAKLLAGDLPTWDQARGLNDYYYWYYGTLALFQFDGPDSGNSGNLWRAWNKSMVACLVDHQATGKDGCRNGSWDADDRWSCEGGRVAGTALNALTLEVYYRYENAFGTPKHANKTGSGPKDRN